MVNIVVIASDQQDIHPRKWAIWADYEPTSDWSNLSNIQQEDSLNDLIAYGQNKHSGDTMVGDADLPDGEHSIYFGIAQGDGADLGTYSGTISFDGISKTFAGFDDSVIGKWDVTVRNNKVVSMVGAQQGGKATSIFDKIKGAVMSVETELKNGMTHEFIMANWPWVALGVAVPVVGGGTFLYFTKRRGRRV